MPENKIDSCRRRLALLEEDFAKAMVSPPVSGGTLCKSLVRKAMDIYNSDYAAEVYEEAVAMQQLADHYLFRAKLRACYRDALGSGRTGSLKEDIDVVTAVNVVCQRFMDEEYNLAPIPVSAPIARRIHETRVMIADFVAAVEDRKPLLSDVIKTVFPKVACRDESLRICDSLAAATDAFLDHIDGINREIAFLQNIMIPTFPDEHIPVSAVVFRLKRERPACQHKVNHLLAMTEIEQFRLEI